MPGMPVCLREHVNQDIEKHHVGIPRPPGHPAGRVEVEGVDRRVRVYPHAPVAVNDLGARLLLGGPLIGVVLGVGVPPGQVLGERTPEDLAEVLGLADRQVLVQAEEVCPGGGGRPGLALVEVSVAEQRYRAVLEVRMGGPAQLLARHRAIMSRSCERRGRLRQ